MFHVQYTLPWEGRPPPNPSINTNTPPPLRPPISSPHHANDVYAARSYDHAANDVSKDIWQPEPRSTNAAQRRAHG